MEKVIFSAQSGNVNTNAIGLVLLIPPDVLSAHACYVRGSARV